MGLVQTKQQLALMEAKKIREDLYNRVEATQVVYAKKFAQISNQTKKLILTSSASELIALLDQHKTSCQQVMLSFIQRTATVGVQNNYVIDEMFEEALQKAKQCDKIRSMNKEKKSWKPGMNLEQCFPPYYGVPISIKETILMKGKQSYAGFVSKINSIPKQQTMIMQAVLNMGFIPFVRSNVPQGVKTLETNNNMFGYCHNPWNKQRSAGGSSGGQSGLVASYCSPIGLGSDIGGSLRVPAQWCGLFTLKANGRITKMGNAYYGKYAGGSPVRGAIGFLTRGTDDLIITTSYLCQEKNYENMPMSIRDPYIHLKQFKNQIFEKKPALKIGFLTHLQTINCSLTHQRAVHESVEILQSFGHKTFKVQLPNFEKLFRFLTMINMCDDNVDIFKELRGNQPLIKEYRNFELLTKIPWLIRKIIIWFIRKKLPRVATMLEVLRKYSAKQLLEQIYQNQFVISRKIYEVFSHNELDVLITPGFALPAPKHGEVPGLQYCFSYASSWNVIHYPVGSVPITTVRRYQTQYSDKYNDVYTKNMQKNIKDAVGMPVGIQVVSLPYHQQTILYVMNQLQKTINFRRKNYPPY